MGLRLKAAAFSVLLFPLSPFSGASAQDILTAAAPVTVKTEPVKSFQVGRDNDQFGKLTYLGGMELISADRNVGGLSSLISLKGGSEFLAVTDNGLWFAATVEQDADGRPLGLSNTRYTPLIQASGKPFNGHYGSDTEAMTLDGASLLVSAEGVNRIYRFPWPLTTGKEPVTGEIKVSPAISELRSSKGMETMAMAPAGTPLAGTLVVVGERGPGDADDLPGFLLRDGKWERFTVARSDRFDATDGAFLPDGDFLLLERRFNLRDLVGMRIRRFAAADLVPGARVTGEVLLEADYGYQIDNMEGLAVHVNEKGQTILTLLSDNNRSLLQRTLLLRFRLDG
ncbi:esterase-like activity of phytase family protein [Roseibium litorale]|nr:esterase-like activity of phytase family protein [Roseibium litorale]